MSKFLHEDDAKAIAIPRVFPKTSELMKAECLPNLCLGHKKNGRRTVLSNFADSKILRNRPDAVRF